MRTYTLDDLDKLFEIYIQTLDNKLKDEDYDTEQGFVSYYGPRFLRWLADIEIKDGMRSKND